MGGGDMAIHMNADIKAACEHCAAGDAPKWQVHSNEWVHTRSPKTKIHGAQFSITLCGANNLRKKIAWDRLQGEVK